MTNDTHPQFSTPQEDALSLMASAMRISKARKSADKAALVLALDENFQVWTAIQTLVERKENLLPTTIKENLLKISKYVVQKTLSEGLEATTKTLDSLENINIQIARGLLENLAPPALKDNAATLLRSSFNLSDALETKDIPKALEALDENLHIWVGMKTLIDANQLDVDIETKSSLLKLYDFITKKTYEVGRKMDFKTIESFININIQIAEGFLETIPLKATEEDALALLRCAVALTNAKDTNDVRELVAALQNNLELWVGIKTLVMQPNHPLAEEIKQNLNRLADFTAQKTFEIGEHPNPQNKCIDTLINVNLQISEGLLERVQFTE